MFLDIPFEQLLPDRFPSVMLSSWHFNLRHEVDSICLHDVLRQEEKGKRFGKESNVLREYPRGFCRSCEVLSGNRTIKSDAQQR